MGGWDSLSLVDHVCQSLQDPAPAETDEGQAAGEPQGTGADTQEEVGGDWNIKENHRTHSVTR